MNNKQTASAFAQGQSGIGNNMISYGDEIYSYGYHWPIAVKLGGMIFLNISKYGNTTSRHTFHVKQALEESGQEYKTVTLPVIKKISRRSNL